MQALINLMQDIVRSNAKVLETYWNRVCRNNKMEYLLEVPKEESQKWASILEECMEKAGLLYCPDIPLKAVSEIGDFWIH